MAAPTEALVLLLVRDLAAARTRAVLVTAEQVVRRAREVRLTASGIRLVERAVGHLVEHPAAWADRHEILAGRSVERAAGHLAVWADQREIPEAQEIRHTLMARGIRLVGLAAEARRAEQQVGRGHRQVLADDQSRPRTRTHSIQGQDRIEAPRIPQDPDSIEARRPLLLSDIQHFPVRGPAAHLEEPV
jgi:hypothetical protein